MCDRGPTLAAPPQRSVCVIYPLRMPLLIRLPKGETELGEC